MAAAMAVDMDAGAIAAATKWTLSYTSRRRRASQTAASGLDVWRCLRPTWAS